MTRRKPREFPDPLKGMALDAITTIARDQVLDAINGAVDETGMSRRQAALMKKDLIGRWRLTRMSNLDNEFMEEESPAFIEFTKSGGGEFHFGYVTCQIDWRPEQRQSKPGAAFTFDGNDEMDPTQGRGWAVVKPDGTLNGHVYFHQGDDSAFWAKRQDR